MKSSHVLKSCFLESKLVYKPFDVMFISLVLESSVVFGVKISFLVLPLESNHILSLAFEVEIVFLCLRFEVNSWF